MVRSKSAGVEHTTRRTKSGHDVKICVNQQLIAMIQIYKKTDRSLLRTVTE